MSLGPLAPLMVLRPFFQLGACGPMKVRVSTSAPGALLLIVFSKSVEIKFSWVAQAVDEV